MRGELGVGVSFPTLGSLSQLIIIASPDSTELFALIRSLFSAVTELIVKAISDTHKPRKKG